MDPGDKKCEQLVETNMQWKDFIMRGSVQSVKQLTTVKSK